MATPIISILRRNQGYILAVMGVVLIITWVIGPVALDFLTGGGGSRGRQSTETPVVQWNKGGTPQFLSERDLVHLRQEHMIVLDFAQRVVKKGVDEGLRPQAPGLSLTPNQRTGEISIGLPMDNSEATVVNILLFAERGRELGVRVDKEAMVAYLKNLSGHSFKTEGDILAVARETVADAAQNGQVISVDSLLTALRNELTAQQAQYMFAASVSNVSTGELWDLHKQLNQRYRIEAYPIDVEKLKAGFKAADAKPDEIMALFNKGNDRVPNPDLPEPGFKTPHRIAFGYCTVNYEVFLEIAKKNVPEAKALERYKKGIAQGDFRKPPPIKAKPKETTPGEEKPAEPEKKAEPKPVEPDTEDKKPAEKPAEKKAEPAAEKAAAEKPTGVAVICEEEPAKEAKADETKKPAEPKPATEKSAAKEETKTDPAKTEPAKTPDSATPPGAKTEDANKTEKEAEKEEIQHKTYAEVKDDILTELAQAEATQLRNAAVQNAMEELRLYSTKLKQYVESKAESKAESQVGVEDPGEFKPVAFANKYQFAHGKTNLVDRHQAATTDLGQFAILQQGPQGSISFAQMAFFGSANLYDPQEASSIVGDTKYIYWRIEDQPEQAVELEKDGSLPPATKAQVEQAWLKQKAFEAAEKRAKDLAAKIKGTSLREVVGKTEEAKVVQPVPFSRLTTNGQQMIFGGQPEFSQPNGIPMAGKEFMDAVFSLQPGQAGVAVDQPHNIVYVVHVVTEAPSLEIRREMFLEARRRGQMSDLMIFANLQKRSEMQSLFDDLEKHFSVKWSRAMRMGGGDDE